jgi:hypothetical protein
MRRRRRAEEWERDLPSPSAGACDANIEYRLSML